MSSTERLLRFNGTSLVPADKPEWYVAIDRDAEETGGDIVDIYRRNGVYQVVRFGDLLDTIDIYDAGSHGYLVEYYDAAQCLATIIIDDNLGLLEFKVRYLYPWVALLKEQDRTVDGQIRAEARRPASR